MGESISWKTSRIFGENITKRMLVDHVHYRSTSNDQFEEMLEIREIPFESGDDQPFDEGNDKERESPRTHYFPRQVME